MDAATFEGEQKKKIPELPKQQNEKNEKFIAQNPC